MGPNSKVLFTSAMSARWYTMEYAVISPFGSSGTSQIIRAYVKDTSGKEISDGGPGTEKYNNLYLI